MIKRRLCRKGQATERKTLTTNRRTKCLTSVNTCMKEFLTITAAFGISGVQVTRILYSITLQPGFPATIRTDKGRKYTCRALAQFADGYVRGCDKSSPIRRNRTDILKFKTDAFPINSVLKTGSATLVMPWKPSVNGVRITTSAAHTCTPRLIIRRHLNLQKPGERVIRRGKDPALLTEPSN